MFLDRSAVEEAVTAQFEDREGVPVELVCDPQMQVRTDARYRCAGVTADGETVEIELTLIAEGGGYTWAEV
jgi:hypothetical protein